MKSDATGREALQLTHPPPPKPSARREREQAVLSMFAAARALDERVESELYPDRALTTKLSAHTIDSLMRVAAWLRAKGEKVHAELERENGRRKADDVSGR